jgi:hypothetical protein
LTRPTALAGARTDVAVCEGEHHELGAGLELQLAHDVRAVRVDRADGDEELLADLLVRVAEGEQVDDVARSFGERLEVRRAAGGDELRAEIGLDVAGSRPGQLSRPGGLSSRPS